MKRLRNPPAPRALAIALPRGSSDPAARAVIGLAVILIVSSLSPVLF
jgi:hypothetical protein